MSDKKKYDIIIGNPPYEGKGKPLYLQILEKVVDAANEVIWICPSQWVKNYKDTNYVKSVKDKIKLSSHVFIANPFENAAMANEIGIFKIDSNNEKEDYEDIRLEKYKNPKLAKSILLKFETFNDNIEKYTKIDLHKKYYVRAQWIRGNVHGSTFCWDWTTLFGQDQRKNFSFKPKDSTTHYWNFDTEEECKNFISSTETDICMFAHYIGKINTGNNNQVIKLIPWLGDYTHPWTEEMIQKELGITDEELEYIHEEMKDFGWKVKEQKNASVL